MPNDPLENLFQQTRQELQSLGSVLPEVQQRIQTLPIKPRSQLLPRSIAAVLVLATFLALLITRIHTLAPTIIPNPDLHLEVNGTELTEHIAAILDHRVVVVIWTYRGHGISAVPDTSAECRAGKYQLRTLHQHKLPDGRTFVCSLFLPDPAVSPALEPPSLYTTSTNNTLIACTTSPRLATPAQLTAAIQSASGDGSLPITVQDIVNQLSKQIH
ncbi:MAG TPA: hypothetical protein VFE58_04815 [Tepidisphaeraceae bacterium]|jgi:hypothetical protein|nr:hypothetical protein [Tepidisphaeraceae bacterium]